MCKYSAEKESRMIAALSKLPKMVTDDPKGNFEVMLNLVYGKDGWSYIRYGDEDMQITDFCFKELCPKFGCPEFADQTMASEEQDQLLSDCVFDICPVATVYAALSGYSHLRDRLRKHEDAMTNRVLTLEEVRNSEVDTFGTVMHWLGIVGFVENERNSIQCGIVVDKGYTAAYSSYRYDADTGRSSSTSHGPQYRICIEGEKNGEIVQYWFSATEEEYARSRIGEFFAR